MLYGPRFAQFFLSPMFTPSATEREVNAVNSENDKNLMNDHWRLHQLEKATSNVEHDFHKFGTGNSAQTNVLIAHKYSQNFHCSIDMMNIYCIKYHIVFTCSRKQRHPS